MINSGSVSHFCSGPWLSLPGGPGRDYGFHAKARSREVPMRKGHFFHKSTSGLVSVAALGAAPSGATDVVRQAGPAARQALGHEGAVGHECQEELASFSQPKRHEGTKDSRF